MAVEVVFAAQDGKLRIEKRCERGTREHRGSTVYSIVIDNDSVNSATLDNLSRHLLVALHYALTVELATTNQFRDGPRMSTLQKLIQDMTR